MSEASKGALKRGVTPTHELMGDWVLENPGGTLREMAAYFGYSPAWLSTVMHSDAFKAYMAERLKSVHGHVDVDVPARMRALAELAIERMTDVLEKTGDADIIKDSFDKVMNRYGYAPSNQHARGPMGAFQQQNNFFVSPEQFQKARELLINSHANPIPNPAPVLPAPADDKEEVPSGE